MSCFQSPAWLWPVVMLTWLLTPLLVSGQIVDLSEPLAKVAGIGRQGEGHDQAISAWKQLARAEVSQLPTLLAAIQEDNPLPANWIRAAVDTIAERTVQQGNPLPVELLESYLTRNDVAPRSRRLAYEWIERVDPTARQRLIPKMLDDSSIELRRDAVASVLHDAEQALQAGNQEAAIAAFRRAMTAARDVDQIDTAYQQLTELGEEINLPRHFGFVTRWKLIGPFDNTNEGGFDVAYPPEDEIVLDATYQGKVGHVPWIEYATDDRYGMVDLNESLGKNMGAAGYGYAIFHAPKEREIELRLGCINANKLWLNGELLTANEVYHSGTAIDQYVGKARLRAGPNHILLKVCQNEQTESWAQDWQFQLRLCDAVGTAVLSAK